LKSFFEKGADGRVGGSHAPASEFLLFAAIG
jgi:hypothetical protein